MPVSIRTRAIAYLVIFFAGSFIGLQFVRPTLTNPPVTADLQAPPEVKEIIRTSCYNCHSNETHIPWFDRIVPAYWLVVRDVKRGRHHLNFSDFGSLSPDKQKAFLYESVNQIQLSAMPPANYKLIHPGSAVTPAQLEVLKNYLHPATPPALTPEAEKEHAKAVEVAGQEAEQQFVNWISRDQAALPKVEAEPNGVAFFPDYKDWKPISTTDRFDNNTFRVILGNDIAQKAIAKNKASPWPDGAAFAKIAWKQHEESNGIMANGQFVQVEFMTKDASKYASTEGWGFGRWRGLDLKPYGGKNANFAMECASCHAPMRENDFVYTQPIRDATPDRLFNRTAALPSGLPDDPTKWRVITSLADKKSATMSTLYGNDAAIAHARTDPQTPYPAGSILALVTWKQQDDAHWFGGRIPGPVEKVEYVRVSTASAGGINGQTYESYSGSPLAKTETDSATATARSTAITGMRAAVMP